MGNIGFLKRALPFLATFALGLFVASFFVSIGGTTSGFKIYKSKCRNELRELRIENEQLLQENLRLQQEHKTSIEFPGPPPVYMENENIDLRIPSIDELDSVSPPPPPPVKSHKVQQR